MPPTVSYDLLIDRQLTSPSLADEKTEPTDVKTFGTNSNRHLLTLPDELKLNIISNLDRVESACLGLTCKQLYAIHWQKHGKVDLEGWERKGKYCLECNGPPSLKDRELKEVYCGLHCFLDEWMGPQLVFRPSGMGFDDGRYQYRSRGIYLYSEKRRIHNDAMNALSEELRNTFHNAVALRHGAVGRRLLESNQSNRGFYQNLCASVTIRNSNI